VTRAEPRNAVVTGASSGIGAAIARALGGLGWSVAIGARRTDKLEDVAKDVERVGGRPFAHPLDVTSPDSIESFFDAAEGALGPVDVVVSNAGTAIPGLLQELSVEDLRTEIDTNLLGPMLVVRRALPGMLERERGDLVFVSSLNAVLPRPLQVGYTATKSGVEAMARTLRMELEGSGVRATIVRPGPTQTELGHDWNPELIRRILEAWESWGILRHHHYLPPESIADAVVAAVTAPAGTHLDLIQINPEAPPKSR
jgi:NADP-dependent 3-hydroxy acid dehydrogenase YdfG